MSKNTRNIGERIRHHRLMSGKSQKDLADLLYVSDKVISKWEMGKSIPDVDVLVDLSNIFHVSIEYLLTGEENKPKTKGAQVIYNEDGTVNKYLGEDGDRLFTRSEVTIILRKRYKRYHDKYLEDLRVTNDDELKVIVSIYKVLKSVFLAEFIDPDETKYPLCKIVRELKEKGASDNFVNNFFDKLLEDGCAKEKEIDVAKAYLMRKHIW